MQANSQEMKCIKPNHLQLGAIIYSKIMKFTVVNGQIIYFNTKLISIPEGCNSLTTRNLPASFWNSNYIYPVPAPTHPQVLLSLFFFFFFCDGHYHHFNWFIIFLFIYLIIGFRLIFNRRQLFNGSMGSACSSLRFVCACRSCACSTSPCLSSQYGTVWKSFEVTTTLWTWI